MPTPPAYYVQDREAPPPGYSGHPDYYGQQPPPPPPAPGGYPGYPAQDSPKHPHGARGYSVDSSAEEGGAEMADFTDRSVRRGFIRKVYSILTVQLLFTLGIIALFIFSRPVKEFVRENGWVYLSAFGIFFATYLGLICVESCRRKTPQNYLCLGLLTASMAYMAGTSSSRFSTDIVFMAVGITAFVTFSLTVFACQTKIDFTLCSGFLCVATLVLIVTGVAMAIAAAFIDPEKVKYLNIAYSGIAALLFSMYLVYDTQLLMGNHRYALSEEEYVLGAIQLYLDIVYIFLSILQIIGLTSSN